jgi:hypothetical protein
MSGYIALVPQGGEDVNDGLLGCNAVQTYR